MCRSLQTNIQPFYTDKSDTGEIIGEISSSLEWLGKNSVLLNHEKTFPCVLFCSKFSESRISPLLHPEHDREISSNIDLYFSIWWESPDHTMKCTCHWLIFMSLFQTFISDRLSSYHNQNMYKKKCEITGSNHDTNTYVKWMNKEKILCLKKQIGFLFVTLQSAKCLQGSKNVKFSAEDF